jgi:hypothetical protein
MNIFILDYDVKRCAVYHNDKHVVKMILESVQMLSTTCRLSGIDVGYKSTHINHPCNIWTRESLSNWRWLKQLVTDLNKEWQERFNHDINHKSFDMMMQLPEPNIKDIGLTKFALAMPEKYKQVDAVESYRDYYRFEKATISTWRNKKPEWF